MGYKTCPYCGANLDPDERCDCRDQVAMSQLGAGENSRPDSDKHNDYNNNREEICNE
ncbi:MAG: hypothetical protein HFI51_02930 [Lachnospiraceae bacterium]|nr:hypothetical protein [Lachnospiraceae bacterium]